MAPGTLWSSVLTLILLVVLGGGAGILAVSLIDSGGLSRLLGRLERFSLRGRRARHTAPASSDEAAPTPSADIELVERADGLVAVGGTRSPAHPAPRSGLRNVPKAYTAVEGTYRDVARLPWWRRAVSLVALAAIVVVLGAASAALAGAAIGAAAELLDGAIG